MTIYEHDRRIQTLKQGMSITSVKLKTHKSFGNIYDMTMNFFETIKGKKS